MNDQIILSICIPVYNQSEMVRDCISEIVRYTGNDIEVVISDDCSTEDIFGLVSSFNDERIRYYRNEKNLGHDLNILNSFKKAKGQFAFLIRVRDRVLSDGLGPVIRFLKDNNDIAYLTGNAVDEKGNKRLLYQTVRYSQGSSAFDKHKELYFHPSGSIYSLSLLDFDKEEAFLKSLEQQKFSFIYHCMARLELAFKGDFYTYGDADLWQYTITTNSSDIAVNSDKNNLSVFSPVYNNFRFSAELKWADIISPDEYKYRVFCWLIERYLKQSTWGYRRRNENEDLQRHYNYQQQKVDIKHERTTFLQLLNSVLDELHLDAGFRKKIDGFVDKTVLKNKTIEPIRYYGSKIAKKTFIKKIHDKNKVKKGIT